jgi:hypothetical protein
MSDENCADPPKVLGVNRAANVLAVIGAAAALAGGMMPGPLSNSRGECDSCGKRRSREASYCARCGHIHGAAILEQKGGEK